MKRAFVIFLFAASAVLVGCGDPQPTNIMESADPAAIEEYEWSIAEEAAPAESNLRGNTPARGKAARRAR